MEKNDIFRVALETTLEGIVLTNSDAKIVIANKAVEKCLGHKVENLIGKDIDIFLPNFLKKIHADHHKKYIKSGGLPHLQNSREVIGLHKDGRLIPLEIKLNMFEFEGKKYTKAHISDISKRKEKEEKIQIAKMKLEAEVEKNTEELERLVKELKRTNSSLEIEIKKKINAKKRVRKALIAERELSQLKTKFISLASHEFRTPLSGILTSATLIEKYPSQNENISKHLTIIKSMVKHLNNILNDFLSLERVEIGDVQYKFSKFRLNKLIEDIIEEAKTFVKNGQILNYSLCTECQSMYQDKKILYIIITNILFNAIKYSPENSSIDILVTENKNVTISITDRGIGIPVQDQKHIFKRFYRASNTSHLQGTGLGLNIVKANIEALGGSISFQSEENKGTEFIIKIPKDIRSIKK